MPRETAEPAGVSWPHVLGDDAELADLFRAFPLAAAAPAAVPAPAEPTVPEAWSFEELPTARGRCRAALATLTLPNANSTRAQACFARNYARLAAHVAVYGDLPDASAGGPRGPRSPRSPRDPRDEHQARRAALTRWCAQQRALRAQLLPAQRAQLEALATPAAEPVWFWSRPLVLWHRAYRLVAREVARARRLPRFGELPPLAGVGDLENWWRRQACDAPRLAASQRVRLLRLNAIAGCDVWAAANCSWMQA